MLKRNGSVGPNLGVARLICLGTVLATSNLHAQEPTRTPVPFSHTCPPTILDSRDVNLYGKSGRPRRGFIKKFASNILLDQKAIWTSPFHINGSSAGWWIFTGLGTAALLGADHHISQSLPFSGTSVAFGNAASRAGQWYFVFPAAGISLALGAVTHNEKLEETGALALQALVNADIVANVLKVSARRARPGDGDHGGHFEAGGSSFPSGHSTQAWALATVLATEYGDHKWIPYVSYGYATLVSVSRVMAQEHFTSDVFVGGAIGFFIGRYVVRTQHAHQQHLHSLGAHLPVPQILPSFSPMEKVIAIRWSY